MMEGEKKRVGDDGGEKGRKRAEGMKSACRFRLFRKNF